MISPRTMQVTDRLTSKSICECQYCYLISSLLVQITARLAYISIVNTVTIISTYPFSKLLLLLDFTIQIIDRVIPVRPLVHVNIVTIVRFLMVQIIDNFTCICPLVHIMQIF